ncbi:hemagglutinin repeat-containing protein [Ralstonia pseudosolanacearum]|uniref:hemagglutinin repeat-containing protein n=1 Tax=Ralstonia pseudosolanacearum TaxID=1310165 RepID=UPI0007D758B1|nr:hemagglutinin repeat-containing protein [Ralstonia pseudosolanacearum]MDC6294822.1 hemagglutinin repeat-containing protein [Ralstonia pseudosolanacearum]MDN3365663.1 hemagglutinin repeat-containing protein [Ralstonia pseudosolanacearum]OAK89106.1 hemagglutinin [Ralstonia pseudosolanacearum]QOK88683.1 filamentous hemagglutinin N-terminal domain-containing protein [Ralstonia pseudosolanacearum]
MNKHLYRIVFNKTRGLLMAVAENVAGDGKQTGTSDAPRAGSVLATVRPLCFSILLAFGLVGSLAQAQIVADPGAPRGQQPTVLNAANGVPLVNIQTPSAGGVSRNTYGQFDVNQQGAVLNNARTSTQTQLGGWVQGNPWLATGTARVILNEVNSSNPSRLRGYVEVAGDRAQVVIANPAGISCDGCGFINSNRVTLTTGTPILNGGNLDGYRVQNGTVSITGGGLDTSRADYTDIIARSVQVNAGIWANTLKVSAGANEVSADHAQTTAIAATGPAPSYGIDVASLGGMYAGKITLVGTEAGVGVRNAGQIGASAGDVTVTADGRLENSGRITASGNVHADTNGGVTNAGTVYAQGDTQLATRGNVVNTGVIAAQGNTTLAATGAASTIDSQAGSVLGAGLLSDGTVSGSGALQLSATGQLQAQGQNFAGADLTAGAASISLTDSRTAARNITLTASGGDLDASRATLSASQAWTANAAGTLRTDGANASADRLALTAHDLSNAQGQLVQTGASDLSIQLPGQLDNTGGRIATNSANLSLGAQTLVNTGGRIEHAGTGTLAMNVGTLSGARGVIGTNGALQLTAQSATLDGGQTSADTLQIRAGTLSNRSGQISQTGMGGASIQASASLDNTGGLITANGPNLTLEAPTFVNTDGRVAHAGTGTLAITGTTVDGARGTISGNGALTLNAQSVTLDGGQTTAGNLTIDAATLSNRSGQLLQTGTGAASVQATERFDNTGGRLATNGSDLTLGAATLTNVDGRIEHAGTGALAITATTLDGARGTIASNGTLALRAQTATLDGAQTTAERLQVDTAVLSNRSGQLVQTGSGAASVRATTLLDNTGGTLAGNGDLAIGAGRLVNQGGTLQAAGASGLAIAATGQIDNSAQGKIGAGGAATIAAASLSNAGGTLTAGDALQVQASGAVDNTQGVLAANRDVSVNAASVANAGGRIGSVQGSTAVVASQGGVSNAGGRVEAAQALTLSGNGIANTDGVVAGQDVRLDSRAQAFDNTRGTVAARGLLDVQSGQLTNDAGMLQAAGALTIDTHGQTLLNTHSGTTGGILGQDKVTLHSGNLDNSAGFIGANGDLSATAAQITNAQGGQISGAKAIALTSTGLDNRGGTIQGMGNVTADAGSGAVDNSGSLMRSGATLDVRAGSVINTGTQGANQGLEGQNVALTADQISNQGGAIRADKALTLTGSGALNNAQGLISSAQNLQVQDRNPGSKTQSVTNTGGTLIAGKSLGVDSAGLSGDGRILSQGDLSLNLAGDFTNTGELQANGNATVKTSGTLTNQSGLKAGSTLTVSAGNIDNTASGEISAGTTNLTATGTLTNRGLIDGGNTNIDAGTLNNLGTGRIYGDHVAIQAGTVNNDVENGTAATIAARNRLDLGAQTLNNREHALIFSGGDMAIGGALDGNRVATGSAATVNNNSASIESLGSLALAANRINNTNEHFSTGVQSQGTQHIVEYQGDGAANRYKPGDPDVYIYNDESDHLHTPEGNYESWHKYEYDRSTSATVITGSDPGKITSAGAMRIDAGTLLNDKSQIIAGGTLSANVGSLQNTEVTGQQTVTDAGTATSYWRHQKKGRDDTGSSSTAYNPPDAISDIRLTPTVYKDNTAPGGSGTQVGTLTVGSVTQGAQSAAVASVSIGAGRTVGAVTQGMQGIGSVGGGRTVSAITEVAAVTPAAGGQSLVVRTGGVNTTLPNNSLFRLNPNPGGSYLVETDPRFASYRTWLSSDTMLTQLSVDPALTQKRLGDGFYEQKLVREQVAQLTGRRFLDGYSSDEAQYRALIDNGVTYAKAWGLRPGVALTAAQMAQLTSDIVWLVEQDVTLPNGQTTRALVPQVYVHVKPGDLDGSGALIAGQSVNLNVSGDLVNQGSIAGRDVVSITAENVKNVGGRITGGDVAVRARTDLDNLGGIIDANNSLSAMAGRDLNVATTTRSNSNAQGSITNVSRIAGLYVTAPSGGTLVASAGRDLTLSGAQIGNASTGGQTVVAAARDLNLGTVGTSSAQSLAWDSKNWRKDSTRQEVGSSIQTNGDLRLSAGNDLNARGASVTSEQGALVATAGNNVNLNAAQTTREVDEAHQFKGSSSWFSKKTITTRNTLSETTTQGTTFSGNTTYVQAGNDINVKGSNVVSTDGTTLIAKHDVNIDAATNSTTERHFREEKKSGLFSSGGIGFTIGTQQQSQDNQDARTTAAASTVGSTNGNVAIGAGNHYQQVGSNVVAPQGDITIQAKKVDILEAQETTHSTQETQFKQSGLTVAVTAPVIAAIQTAQQMGRAAGQTSDGRMKVLAGATTALAGKNAADAVAADPKSGGGVSISITVGGSKSQSKTTQDATQAAGSQVAAGGNVSIQATGAGQDSTLTVQGSDIKGGGDVSLKADGDIDLLAARNASEMHRSSSSVSGGVGVAVSLGSNGAAFGVTANASASRGKGEGSDVSWTNTHVSAGNTLTLESGGNTNLKGAVASGKQVVANVGGDLNIESLQDTSTYHTKDQSIGGSVTVGFGFSGSANFSQQKIDSDFASVTEQSGIKAGDRGFQVNVHGNTDLKGAVIASTDKAVQDGVNSLTTATLTQSEIHNRAEYSASSIGIGGGYSYGGGGMMPVGGGGNTTAGGVGTNQQGQATTGGDKVPGSNVPTSGNWSATPPVVMGASGSGSSVTGSGISGGAIHITDDAKQQALTGKDGEQTVASVNRNVSTERDSSNALKPIFNEKEIQAGFEIVGALQREAGTFLSNRAKEVDQKNAQAKDADAKAADPSNGLTDEQRLALRDQASALRSEAQAINDKWGAGGTYRQITSALMAGVGGNVTGSTAQFAQNMVVNYVQQQGASYIGKLVADGTLVEGSPAHAALHAIVACAGAAASSQSCGSGALGAAASSLLTGLFSETSPDETATQREGKRNLITSLVTGIAAMSGADATTATNGAIAAVDNNWLATQQIVQMKKELSNAKSTLEQLKVASKWAYISTKQDVLTTTGIGKGLAESGWNDVKGVAEFLAHPIEGLKGLKQLISSPDARQQLGDALFKELDAKIDRMSYAIEKGGDENAEQLGKDLGGLLWQVGSVVTGVGGVAKGATKLASVGVRLGTDMMETLSGAAKFDRLLANGGLFAADGKPLMDFRSLSNPQKSIVGDMLGGEKVKQLLPDAQKIGRTPGVGEAGIDDLYKVNKPGVDYVVVEYKFGSSKLGNPADGLQMSDDWITGAKTGKSRVLDSLSGDRVEAGKFMDAFDAGRVEKWLVHTDPFGNVTVGVLDKNGKFFPDPVKASKILGSK